MKDEAIYAFSPLPAAPPLAAAGNSAAAVDAADVARPPKRRRIGQWLLVAALLLTVLTLLAATVGSAALLALDEGFKEGLHITIDGRPWHPELDIDARDSGIALALGGGLLGLLVLLVVAALALPLLVLLVLLSAAFAVCLALWGAVAVAAVALSPLWLSALLLWLLLRPKPKSDARRFER